MQPILGRAATWASWVELGRGLPRPNPSFTRAISKPRPVQVSPEVVEPNPSPNCDLQIQALIGLPNGLEPQPPPHSMIFLCCY